MVNHEYEMSDSPESDEHAGYVGAIIAAAKRQLLYYDNALRQYVEAGGRVLSGEFEWKKTNRGMCWVKRDK